MKNIYIRTHTHIHTHTEQLTCTKCIEFSTDLYIFNILKIVFKCFYLKIRICSKFSLSTQQTKWLFGFLLFFLLHSMKRNWLAFTTPKSNWQALPTFLLYFQPKLIKGKWPTISKKINAIFFLFSCFDKLTLW